MTTDRLIRSATALVVAAVAAFAAVVSYTHIYGLARAHGQTGAAARLLPLSVDGLKGPEVALWGYYRQLSHFLRPSERLRADEACWAGQDAPPQVPWSLRSAARLADTCAGLMAQ